MASPRSRSTANLDYLFSRLSEIPLLSHEEELSLARKIAAGDEEALREMVSANVRLVVRLAKPYRHCGIPFEDMISEGMIGLIEAAKRFDASHGNRFVTFAFWWIRKSILTCVREQSRLVRVPSFQLRKEREVRLTLDELQRDNGGPVDVRDLSQAMSIQTEELERILVRTTSEFSIDQFLDEDDDAAATSLLRDTATMDQELTLLRTENHHRIEQAVQELPEIERTVIARRYGLNGEAPEVLRELGKRLNLSRERVRQIEAKATHRLKRILLRLERTPVRGNRQALQAFPPSAARSQSAAHTLA